MSLYVGTCACKMQSTRVSVLKEKTKHNQLFHYICINSNLNCFPEKPLTKNIGEFGTL